MAQRSLLKRLPRYPDLEGPRDLELQEIHVLQEDRTHCDGYRDPVPSVSSPTARSEVLEKTHFPMQIGSLYERENQPSRVPARRSGRQKHESQTLQRRCSQRCELLFRSLLDLRQLDKLD